MSRTDNALEAAVAAAQQLPARLQRKLAERLIAAAAPDEGKTVVYLRRLPSQKQGRLGALMDKNNEGCLSQSERSELKELGAEVDALLLENSRVLARALRPELFDERGKPKKARLQLALADEPSHRGERKARRA